MEESIDDSVNVKNRFPVFTQDVEANVSFQIDIGMIHLKTEYKQPESEDGANKQCNRRKRIIYIIHTLVLHLTLGAS